MCGSASRPVSCPARPSGTGRSSARAASAPPTSSPTPSSPATPPGPSAAWRHRAMRADRGKGRIVVFGIAFWYPLAGVTFQFLHYLIGLRRLGYDVYYVEDSGRWVYDPLVNDVTGDASSNVAAVAPILEAHGFSGRWAFREAYPGGRCYGMPEQQLTALSRAAAPMLNGTAPRETREEPLISPRRIYVESDPFLTQVRALQGDTERQAALDAHDTHFTFG